MPARAGNGVQAMPLAAGFGEGRGVPNNAKSAEPLPVQPGAPADGQFPSDIINAGDSSRRRFNRNGRPLFVIFQGWNFHLRLFRISAMHGLGIMS